ncbi:MAG: GNAT family N-acetyltransferase [Planctomycetota bacterium]
MATSTSSDEHQERAVNLDNGLPVGDPVPDPTPPGGTITLREIDPELDAEPLFEASHGSPDKLAIWTYMPACGPFEDVAGMHAWLSDVRTRDNTRFLAVIDNATGRAAGMAAFLNVMPTMRCLELGFIWYTPALQRTAANTEAMRILMGEAFDRLGYRRVEWKCDALNARSKAAAVRLGFTYEGRFLQHLIVHGRNRDTDWYALLDRDWPRVRRHLDTWLGAEGKRPSLRELNNDPTDAGE